jgi:hypothetical protein
MLEALSKLVGNLESNPSLHEPNQVRERIEALDRLDAFNLEMLPPVTDSFAAATYRRARTIQEELETANFAVYEAIRRDIKLGRGGRALFPSVSGSTAADDLLDIEKGDGYDYRDELVAGILRFEDPGTAIPPALAEMVFYQPTPVRHIFDLFDRIALKEHDVLIDLGSGLGHVPLLTSICTNARSVGVEVEQVYVEVAQQSAETLNLERVTFLRQDAREADLTEGTAFYLYTPFMGKMLRTVLDSLRFEASSRAIRVCTFGPCTTTVANEDWLQATGTPGEDRISIFRSR